MFYREEKPCKENSHIILSFWEFRIDGSQPSQILHEVFPDGCVSLIFYRNKIPKLFVSEIIPKSIFVPVNAGDTVWGMRILPEACAVFFGKDPSEIKTELFENELLKIALQKCQNFDEAVKVFEQFAEKSGIKPEKIDQRLTKATQIFIASNGLAKISETAREIGLSERHFERLYKKASGLTPKQFARICRFRATAIDAVKNSASNWANRAFDRGFTDQSHLTREFSNLSGSSPAEFVKKIKRIKHEKILE